MSQKPKEKTNSQSKALTRKRGSSGWALERLRSDGLVQLMLDLEHAEEHGLKEEECKRVKVALRSVATVWSAVPDGGLFRKAIYEEYEEFEKRYGTWNQPAGSTPKEKRERQEALCQLRDQRHAIAKRIRKNMHILEENLDLKLIDDVYESLGGLTKALPSLFKELAKAVGRYQKGRTHAS